MPNSSLRNAVKRITHKERSQPQHRKKLGLLEKHKDYKKRAVHYHAQRDKIQHLQRKAGMRNPDEFYFGMTKAQISDKGKGHQKLAQVRAKELEAIIGPQAVRVMKSQDLAYVRMQKQRDASKAQRLQQSLHLIDEDRATTQHKRKHTIFVESAEEAANFNPAQHFETAPELVHRTFNRPRLEQIKQQQQALVAADGDDSPAITSDALERQLKQQHLLARKAAKARAEAYAELEARMKRAKTMARAEAHLVTEKLVASKGRKRKIENKDATTGQPAQYKWRRKRSK